MQQGDYLIIFPTPLHGEVSIDELREHNEKFLVDDVVNWAENSGNSSSRFRLFDTFHKSCNFYEMVVKPSSPCALLDLFMLSTESRKQRVLFSQKRALGSTTQRELLT